MTKAWEKRIENMEIIDSAEYAETKIVLKKDTIYVMLTYKNGELTDVKNPVFDRNINILLLFKKSKLFLNAMNEGVCNE